MLVEQPLNTFMVKKYLQLFLLVFSPEFLELLFDVLDSNEVIDFVFAASFVDVSLCPTGIADLSSLS